MEGIIATAAFFVGALCLPLACIALVMRKNEDVSRKLFIAAGVLLVPFIYGAVRMVQSVMTIANAMR